MVMHMDHKVGQILKTLDRLGIRDNTLVLFTSDNGGAYEANIGPYKGGKTDLHEGGIRVPGIASWPGKVRAGKVSAAVGHHCDILPTFCSAAGVPLPAGLAADGTNLLSHLATGAEPPERGTLHWQLDLYTNLQRHYPKPQPYATEATRRGNWKLLSNDGRPVALYDLAADPLESTNLLEKEPRQAGELAAAVRGFLTAPRNRAGFPN
jgi:N-acetylgalactosamine-6-sulfatase